MKKIILVSLIAATSVGAFAQDIFMGNSSSTAYISPMTSKNLPTHSSDHNFWVGHTAYKDMTLAFSIDPTLVGWAADSLNVVKYGASVYSKYSYTDVIATYEFSDALFHTVDLKANQRISFWFEYADGTVLNLNDVDYRVDHPLNMNMNALIGTDGAWGATYFYDRNDKTYAPNALIVIGDASYMANHSPSGQPLPGILATMVIGLGLSSLYLKKRRKV